jgi:hypothetical protein
MTACRLQAPNWWRTARDALLAAQMLLGDVPELAAGGPTEGRRDDAEGHQLQAVTAAIRWAIEAAVALRMPYDALQPAAAWRAGWRGTCWDAMMSPSGDGVAEASRAALAAAGARCRCVGLAPEQVAAALDQAEHAVAVCYTERRGSH